MRMINLLTNRIGSVTKNLIFQIKFNLDISNIFVLIALYLRYNLAHFSLDSRSNLAQNKFDATKLNEENILIRPPPKSVIFKFIYSLAD